MALNATTLSAAVNIYNTSFGVVSATGVVAPTFSSGTPLTAGVTYALCENEMMVVTGVNGTFITVLRGQLGTVGSSHAASTPILFGLAVDFPNFTPFVYGFVAAPPNRFADASVAVASGTTITVPGPVFHVTGTTAIATMTPAAGFVGGRVLVIFDGICTWTAAGNIAVAGSSTTAGSAVDFFYDPNTSKWYPTRLA